jgi:hypothetical protein
MTAVPPYDRLRLYEQVPIQNSLHTVDSADSLRRHMAFLSDGAAVPRPEVLARLKAEPGSTGSIISYNASFEIRVLEGCAVHFP